MIKIVLIFILLFFAIIGLSCIIHSFVVWVNEPKNYPRPFLLISIDKQTRNMEQIIRYYCGKNLTEKIIIFSTDNDDNNKKIFDIISKNNPSVYFCNTLDEIGELIKK